MRPGLGAEQKADEPAVPDVADDFAPRSGEMLNGKYRLHDLLGAGGMGCVYRAENVLIGRTVAIKVLNKEFAAQRDVVARFLQEARAANLVRHPNVVDVMDIGQDEGGVPFIVQELLQGRDLSAYAAEEGGVLSVEETLTLLLPVIEAVGFAHSKGVVHRDLKPANIFLAEEDGECVPKLLDFGVSHIHPRPGSARMTTPGLTVGTPAYMSPEQVMASTSLDARSDVWALGVILYELLTGRLPFD